MARTCAACGRANDDDASFCQQCGAPLGPPPPPVAPPASGQTFAAAVSPPPPPPASPPGEPPRKGKPAPRWLVALVIVAIVVLVAVMAFAFIPRGRSGDGGGQSPTPTAAATVDASPSPGLGEYLAGAVGVKADRLAAILRDGTVLPVTRFARQQIWHIAYSPDGKWLACVAGTYRSSELWLFDTETGDAKQATADTPEVVAVDSIAWLSPAELLVAGYTETPRSTGQNADFLVYDTVNGKFSPLTGSGGVALRGVSVSASRGGGTIAFVTYTDRKTDQYGMASALERLEVLDRPSGEVKALGENTALFDVNARAFDDPLISPSGEALIYRRAGSDVGTSYTVISTDGSVLMPEKEAMMPAGYAWDPEGTKVVFTGQPLSSSGNQPVSFWLFDTQTGEDPKVIARYAHTAVQDLAWSPDGSVIAWAEYDQKQYETGTIYVMPATGGDSDPLAKNALSPAWAPGAKEPLQVSPSP
jgi:Tol biopolymer transport system component